MIGRKHAEAVADLIAEAARGKKVDPTVKVPVKVVTEKNVADFS